MPRYATRLDRRLVKELVKLARGNLTPAEITRLIGDRAQAAGRPRPSYARVRQLVLEHRPVGPAEPSWGSLVLDVALRNKHPGVLEQKSLGTLPAWEDAGLER